MSTIKTALVLKDAQTQYSNTITDYRQRPEVFVPLYPFGDAVRVGTAQTPQALTIPYASQTPAGTYGFSTSVDMAGFNSAVVLILVTVLEAAKIAHIKPQWSIDNSLFYDEPVAINGTTVGTDAAGTLEQQFDYASKQIQVAMDTAQGKIERSNRLARYFRLAAKSNATTGKISITVQLQNN